MENKSPKSFLDEKTKNFVKKRKRNYKRNEKTTTLLQDIIPSWTLVHLSSKAAYNDITDGKTRKALYEISMLKTKYVSLSDSQVEYLEDILQDAIAGGIIEAPCKKSNCKRCEELKDIMSER